MAQYPNQGTPLGYTKITNVTPSDTLPAPPGTKAIMCEVTGNIAVMMPGAATPFLLTALPAFAVIPISPAKIMATGTTATNIVAMG
jgi:hypothetical protein